MSGANSWLSRQRKTELVELAEEIGFTDYDGMKKHELEVALDEYLTEGASVFATDPKLQGYYNRSRTAGSPVKREAPALKVARRRTTRAAEGVIAATDGDDDDDDDESSTGPVATSTALLARTPGRAVSLASRIPLPATPADVAQAVDRGTVAVRARVASLYTESGFPEATQATRESLSTVPAVMAAVALLELYLLRPEVLTNRYAFTVPAVPLLGTPDQPVYVPDMFLMLSSSFWSPVLTWLATAFALPALFGYFFNLGAAARVAPSGPARGRAASRARELDYPVDPLAFSVVKAILTYVVYGQGYTLGGLIDPSSIARINSAMYQEWRGVVAGCLVTGIAAVYEAILRK